MNGTSTKLTAAGAAGAVTIILVWGVGLTGLVIPNTVAAALTLLIGLFLGWLVKETAIITPQKTDPPAGVPPSVMVETSNVTTAAAPTVTPAVLPVIPPK